jgi:hypothetical protein
MRKRGFIAQEVLLIEKELGLVERKIWKLIFHFKYRKLLTLLLIAILAYFLFRNPSTQGFVLSLGELEYLGVFIAGMFFTFGFTTPFAIGFFVVLNPINPLLTALIGGAGAVIGDLAIFSLIRFSFMDEFKRLERTMLIRGISKEMKVLFNKKVRAYILYALAGLIIASPLPDEAGVIMLAGLSKIKPHVMAIISFIFNSLGIYLMCLI